MSYIFYIWGFFDWTPIFWIFLIEPLSCCRATFQVAHWQIFYQKKNTTSQVLTMIKSIVSKKTDPVLYKGSIRLWKWPNYYTNIGVCILGRSDTIIIIKILYVLSAKVVDESMNFKKPSMIQISSLCQVHLQLIYIPIEIPNKCFYPNLMPTHTDINHPNASTFL